MKCPNTWMFEKLESLGTKRYIFAGVLYNVLTFVDIDDCAMVNCTGHGNCTDLVNGYTCHCDAGYRGINCETGRCIVFLNRKFANKLRFE